MNTGRFYERFIACDLEGYGIILNIGWLRYFAPNIDRNKNKLRIDYNAFSLNTILESDTPKPILANFDINIFYSDDFNEGFLNFSICDIDLNDLKYKDWEL